MDELRWILIVCGLVLLAGVYLYSRYRAERPGRDRPRREPVLDSDTPELPTTSAEPVGEPDPAPETPGKIVAVRLMAKSRPGFPGEKLVLTLRKAGLRHGRYGIFHRHADGDTGPVQFSVASLVEPGSFDIAGLKDAYFPGVSIFMALPGECDGIEAFDEMLSVARLLATELDGELADDQGSTLSIQRQRFMREDVLQFLHRMDGAAG